MKLKREIEWQIIARKLVLVENENIFDEDEMKLIRAKAFLSCVESGEVCLSAETVAKLFHRSPTTIRRWCWGQKKLRCYRDYRGKKPGEIWAWYEIPLSTVVDLKKTGGNVNEFIGLDIKKVDF